MEFNNKKAEISTPEVSAQPPTKETITLKSSERPTINTLNNVVKVDVAEKDINTIIVSHDVRNLVSELGKDSISRSLVTIYGKSGRLFASSKEIEAAEIPLSQYPIKLEYELTTIQNGKEVEYKGSQLVNTSEGTSYTTLTGKETSSVSELTIPESISTIDSDLVKIKNNLESFSFVYDKSQNKSVPLHEMLNNITTKLDILTKSLYDVKEKVKDL